MKSSISSICSILSHEAIVRTAYVDSAGKLTIGAGHTKAAGAPVPRLSAKRSFFSSVGQR